MVSAPVARIWRAQLPQRAVGRPDESTTTEGEGQVSTEPGGETTHRRLGANRETIARSAEPSLKWSTAVHRSSAAKPRVTSYEQIEIIGTKFGWAPCFLW